MSSLAQQQRRLVEQHRRAQVGVQAGFLAEFLAAWGLLRTEDLDRSTPQWLRIVIRLIRLFRQESADLSLQHYRDLRRIGAPDTEFPEPEVAFDLGNLVDPERRIRRQTGPSVPARVERELRQITRPARLTIHWDRADRAAVSSLQVAGPINIKARISRGEQPEAAKRAALVDASGAGSRQVLNGGRSTQLALVQNDRAALGWVRVTDGNPCAFCAMLASRGVTWGPYAKSSFAKANEKFSGKTFEAEHDNDPRIVGRGEVKVHDHCGCGIALVFRRDDPLLDQGKEYRLLWDQYIKGHYSNEKVPGRQSDALKAWRRLHERPEVFKRKLGEIAEPEAA
jgi:hypothetical protein